VRRIAGKYGHVPAKNHYDREEYARRLAAPGYVDIRVDSIRENVYPGMAKYMRERIRGKKIDDVVVELTDDDRAQCRGVSLWEKTSGFSDYVIVSARKPFSRPVPEPGPMN
jgi:microcystin synthetase protein McyJ